MAKRLTYADALRILGQNDPEAMDLAERLTDGGLGLMGVPDLFGARGALVSGGRRAIEGIRGKLSGESRLSRTEKIEAAHQIIMVVAFFEAVEESLEELDAPFALKDLEFTKEEQTGLMERVLAHSGSAPALSLGPGWASRFFSDFLFRDFARALTGLAVAERHGLTSADHTLLRRMGDIVPEYAARRYRESYRQLSADVPEFGMWVHLAEHESTRAAVGTGLGELRRYLEEVGSHREVDDRRRELSAGYQAVLRQPVLRSDDLPPGISLPTLEEAYVAPRGRAAYAVHSGTPSTEEWWDRLPVVDDLQPVIAAHLVHPLATEVPTVILGHPGAGKSKFTEMLAARLPASDFLPIRVELRSVQPNAPIHAQIEDGLATTLHTRVSWRELAESADGALPVVILDGFDELLQATGVDRSDYLERIQEFQHQQEALGQPVAVIVTSRTVVADRARFPDGSMVMRLEPFDEEQIGRMLEVWNRANSSALASQGLEPLTADVLMTYRELAEQPLLLLMLLIYDAGDNGLRRVSRTLTHGELYERLLTMFARREVDKHHSGLGRDDFDDEVENELRRLEVAALAMFTRRRQSVGADELDRDLTVLMPDAAVRAEGADLHGRIAPAHQVLGRFFFVHEARAKVSGGDASVFEFLHATFGEYLVARAVAIALEELHESRSRSSRRRGRAAPIDDGELYALSSFATYAGREKVVDFLAELLERRFAEEPEAREDYARLLVELFQEAPFPASNRSHTAYEPVRLPLTRREANYTSNLMILLCLVREDPVDVRELFPDSPDTLQDWQHTAALWRTLPGTEWFSIVATLRVRHLGGWADDGAVTVVGLDDSSPVNVGESMGFELRMNVDAEPDVLDPYEITVPHDTTTSRLLRSTAMRVNGTAARFLLGLLPYLRHVSDDLATWYWGPRSHRESFWLNVHEVLRLRLVPAAQNPGERLETYGRFFTGHVLGPSEHLALRQAVEDLNLPSVDSGFVDRLQRLLESYLSRVTEVVTGPQPNAAVVAPTLRGLRSFVSQETLSRVLDLVQGNTLPEIQAQAIDTVAPASRDRDQAGVGNYYGSADG
ncbi:NACHT domain-containing protein [Nocardiopsis halotolerans]|uniref:NACHT domain-containing protein n=1 Tax=Nocardiopsis halotolerans TaxID=124252 RepID=UPI00034AB17E|nr:ATP-binding protein [Nocardiopsis halotolerans]